MRLTLVPASQIWPLPNCLIYLFLLSCTVDALSPDAITTHIYTSSRSNKLALRAQACLEFLWRFSFARWRTTSGQLGVWEMVQIAAVCGAIPGLWLLQKHWRGGDRKERLGSSSRSTAKFNPTVSVAEDDSTDAEATDPGLLKKHSELKSYTTSRFKYPAIRVFFRRHPQADKLPTTPAPLPLLVFIHGLGGSVAQFNPLLTSLVNLASCLSIDLPGCGMSKFKPTSWDAYKTEALVELLSVIIEDYREKEAGQGVILIGHSMGCSLAALLASRNSPHLSSLSDNIMGLIAICPKADPPTEKQVAAFRKLLLIPGPIFDLWRRWDRRGGVESASVARFVGPDSDIETKKLQVRFNEQSRTPVWRRMASGSLPIFESGVPKGGLPGEEIWSGLSIPVFLVAGEADHITPPGEIEKISAFLGKSHPIQIDLDEKSETLVDSAAPVDTSLSMPRLSEFQKEDNSSPQDKIFISTTNTSTATPPSPQIHDSPSTPTSESPHPPLPPQPRHPHPLLHTTILPSPASHSLLYTPNTSRTLAGVISTFLATTITARLSLGWQLTFLSTSGKWDVKNLAKWTAVKPVSEPIAGVFRAMKTLREVDDEHCPKVFVERWGGEIGNVVDVSHEVPCYDMGGLEAGGVRYWKMPSVSKVPPSSQEIAEFIGVVDRIREGREKAEGDDGVKDGGENGAVVGINGVTGNHDHSKNGKLIGVHCHYGFNRTGYFIVCYLVERMGYSVQEALDEFKRKRPKGIKHAHFMDQLFVRYCVGLKTDGEEGGAS